MTTTNEGTPELPCTIHFTSAHTVALSTDANGHAIFSYGDELELTQEIVALSRDRFGNSTLLARLASGDAGIHLGAWPDLPRLLPGSLDWAEQRELARQAAWKIEDEAERKAALVQVQADFGFAVTSKTLQVTT